MSLCRFCLPLGAAWALGSAAIQPSGTFLSKGGEWEAQVEGPGGQGTSLKACGFAVCPPELMPRPQKEEQSSGLCPPRKSQCQGHSQVGPGL